jgi:hypothetical protein
MASISPICKKCKNFISALKSPTYIDFMIKKSLTSKTSKSHTWAPLNRCLTKITILIYKLITDMVYYTSVSLYLQHLLMEK